MSLAATLAASGMRPASFLPTVKCSSCGDEIEISAMGDHLCNQSPPSPNTASVSTNNPFKLRQTSAIETKPSQPSPLQFSSDTQLAPPRISTGGPTQIPVSKPPKHILPPINPAAANQPFLGPSTQTPLSPASSTRSGESGATDGTSKRPGEEEWSAQDMRGTDNLPSLQVDTFTPVEEHYNPVSLALPPPSPISPQPWSAYSSQPQSAYSLLPQSASSSQPQSARSICVDSPMSSASGFSEVGMERRPSAERRASSKSKGSDGGLRSISGTIRQALSRKPSEKKLARNRAAKSEEALPLTFDSSGPGLEHRPTQRRIPPQRPARPEEGLPADLLHPMSTRNMPARAPSPPLVLLQDTDRSKTLPTPLPSTDESLSPTKLSKMTSEPALRRKAGSINSVQVEPFGSQDQRTDESRVDHRIHDAPPVPKPVQLHRKDSLHKSSESDASTTSVSLSDVSRGNSNTTSGTSPVVSVTNSVDVFMLSTYERNSGDDGPRVAASVVKPPQRPQIRAEPLQGYSVPQIAPIRPAAEVLQSVDGSVAQRVSPPSAIGSSPLESPMDPALQKGKLSQEGSIRSVSPAEATEDQLSPDSHNEERLSSDVYDPKRSLSPSRISARTWQQRQPRSKASAQSEFQGFNFEMFTSSPDQESNRTPSPEEDATEAAMALPLTSMELVTSEGSDEQSPQPLPPPTPATGKSAHRPLLRQGTVGAKAVCRGCCRRIEGKSVKAADGGLTGKWHQACFVCHSCKQPFETADFYVMNNLPYCEQHYHEMNGSVCHSCHRGIEGEFLETASGPGGRVVRKYHRRCFTCVDCRVVLSEDYFEIGGRVQCERHAMAAMRSLTRRPPPGSVGFPTSRLRGESFKAERQRTRLMPR